MPVEGENMIRYTLQHCIVTPYSDKLMNEEDKIKWCDIYTNALQFGVKQIRGDGTKSGDAFYKLL